RARRRGHSPAHRPQGAWQGRRHAGASGLMELRAEPHGPHVVVVTIDNQPRCNAMPRAMMAELAALWDRLELDGTCRCIVLTGAGARALSSGADVSGDLSADPETARIVNHALLKNRAYAKPIVAAVNGDCVAGGLELLLSTDVRAAAPHARFGLPEVRWSIYPFGGATVKLVEQIGYVHAMELLLTARLIDAAEAARLGLVNRVVPADALMPWALETAETIAANSPTAVQAVKQQISSTIADHAAAREALEQELGDRVRKSEHFQEGAPGPAQEDGRGDGHRGDQRPGRDQGARRRQARPARGGRGRQRGEGGERGPARAVAREDQRGDRRVAQLLHPRRHRGGRAARGAVVHALLRRLDHGARLQVHIPDESGLLAAGRAGAGSGR